MSIVKSITRSVAAFAVSVALVGCASEEPKPEKKPEPERTGTGVQKTMVRCNFCGSTVENFKFCSNCGKTLGEAPPPENAAVSITWSQKSPKGAGIYFLFLNKFEVPEGDKMLSLVKSCPNFSRWLDQTTTDKRRAYQVSYDGSDVQSDVAAAIEASGLKCTFEQKTNRIEVSKR